MADSTPFTIGVEALCTDGPCGRVTQVVIDPMDETVTHLVVEPEHREGLGRLVPIRSVDAGPDNVKIHHTKAEFEKLPKAESTHFLPGVEGIATAYDVEQTLLWPYFGGNTTVPVTVETLPVGEVAIRRGEDVYATDGRIGEVEGLVVDPASRHVSHLLLKEGHLFGRKEVAIPIHEAKAEEGGIKLSMTKREVDDLPPVDIMRPTG